MRPLDATLGLRRVGADDVDVELRQRAAELRVAPGLLSAGIDDAEDTRLVAVEGDRLAVSLEVGPRRGEIVEGRLRSHEAKLLEPARRIVHVDEQGATRAPVLEPVVVAAVDLDELAETRSAVPRLVSPAGPLRAGHPQTRTDHPLAQRLDADRDTVVRRQLLACERRTEVGVALAHERHGRFPRGGRELAVARLPALARDEPACALLAQGPAQPPHLAFTEPELLRCAPLRQASLGHAAQHLQPVELPGTHRHGPRPRHVGLQGRHGAWNRTFLSGRNRTFSFGLYTFESESGCYGNVAGKQPLVGPHPADLAWPKQGSRPYRSVFGRTGATATAEMARLAHFLPR